MFDLEKAINAWLKQFRKHRAFNHGSIREMELHLRDHIDDLVADGCSEKKAFEQAVSEFGDIRQVAAHEFRNLRPRSTFFSQLTHNMFGNNLKIAIRNFTKQPFFTFLNIFGLAIGMSGGLLIGLFIYDELSFDKAFADADRIYRINIDNKTAGEFSQYAAAPGPMADVLTTDCPQVEMVTRFRQTGSTLIRQPQATQNVKETHVTAVDSSFFTMFGLDLLEGNPETALKEPNSIVLTTSAVNRLFGSEKAIGKNLMVDNNKLFVVTGVMDDLPRNSFLRNHGVFISLSSFDDAKTVAWNTWYFPTFVKLHRGARLDDLQGFLDTVQERYLIPWAMTFVPGLTLEALKAQEKESGDFMDFNTTALTDIHLYSSDRRGEFSPNSDIQNVYIISFIGVFLILLASVNFMNLSTAHSLTRAKEVGIRKTLGSDQLGLIRQFLTESSLISLFSLVLSIVVAVVALPFFNNLAGRDINIPFTNPVFWTILVCATLLLGLISGSYPAFFLSQFVPSKVLKGKHGTVGGGQVRNALVVFQFAISVFLIVSTLVVFQQINFIQHKDLGFQKDQVLIIDDLKAAGDQVESLKEEIKRINRVEDVSLSSYLPTPSARHGSTYFPEGAMENGVFKSDNALIIEQWTIDYDYANALGLEIIAGRNFDRQFSTDSSALLLNETVVQMMELEPEEVLGRRLTTDFHRPDKENMEYLTVIGVVKNFHFESLRNGIDALSLILGNEADRMIVKLSAGDFSQTIGEIEERWDKVAPGQPLNYYFMDDSFNDTYQAEQRLGRIFMVFTMLSLCIACLGLFGLATFNAERRTKEIGIKKVMGASVKQITFQLSAGFLKLVAIALVVSLPLSWYAMNKWLEAFTYRIEITWWTFAVAAFLAVAIAVITVSYQSIKAAIMNPVNSLRSE